MIAAFVRHVETKAFAGVYVGRNLVDIAICLDEVDNPSLYEYATAPMPFGLLFEKSTAVVPLTFTDDDNDSTIEKGCARWQRQRGDISFSERAWNLIQDEKVKWKRVEEEL